MKFQHVVLAASALLAANGAHAVDAAAAKALASKSACLSCHAADKKLVGPSYKDVAAKHKGQADAVAKVAARIKSGGSGMYGPVPMPPQAAAAAMRSGEIDGVAFPYEGATSFNLIPETGSIIELPGGFYNASWFLGINQAKWDAIEPRDQAAIEEISGLLIAELAGKAFDNSDYLGRQACLEAGVSIARAGEAMDAEIRRLAAVHERAWIDQMAGQGFDGAWILQKMRRSTSVERL